ncbi:MAG: hypothetical protein H0U70_09375 [Tatlockia sp.]|nr:hypothetical protein [Tatlockia sp.]
MFNKSAGELKDLLKIGFYLSMLCGFLIFSGYFIKVGYFPSTNLQSILYLPIIAALTGILFFVCFIGLFGLAPYLWVELLKKRDTCQVIVGSEHIEEVISRYKLENVKPKLKCPLYLQFKNVPFC